MQSCDLLVCCKNDRSESERETKSQLTRSTGSAVSIIFVIALLIASHEMNYKIIGMLFILLARCVLLCVRALHTQLKYALHYILALACRWNDQYSKN